MSEHRPPPDNNNMDVSDRRRSERDHDRRSRDRSLTPDMKRRRRYSRSRSRSPRSRSRSRSRSRERGRDRYDSASPRDRDRQKDRYDSESPPRSGRDRRRYRSRSPSRDSRSRSRSRSLDRDFGRRRRRERGMRSRRRRDRDRKRRHDSRSRSPRHDDDGGDSRSPPRRRARRDYSRSPRRGRDSRRMGRGPYFDEHQTHSLFVAALDNAAQRHTPPFNVSIVNDRMRQLDHTWDISNSDYKRFADLCQEMHRRRVLEVARVRETICVTRFLPPQPPLRPLEGRPDVAPDFDRNSRRRDYDDYDRRRGRDDDRYRRGRDERRDDDRGYRASRMRDEERRRREERFPHDRRRDDEAMRDRNVNVGEKGTRVVDMSKSASANASLPADNRKTGPVNSASGTDNKMTATASAEGDKKGDPPAVTGGSSNENTSTVDGGKTTAADGQDASIGGSLAENSAAKEQKDGSSAAQIEKPNLEKMVVNKDVMANESAGDAKEKTTAVIGGKNPADLEKLTESKPMGNTKLEAEYLVKQEVGTVQNMAVEMGHGVNNTSALTNGDTGNTRPEANGVPVVDTKAEMSTVDEVKKATAGKMEGVKTEAVAQ